MHKINLKKPLLLISGKPVIEGGKELILSEVISESIVQDTSTENALKLHSLCEKIYQSGTLEVDDSDLEIFKKAVESNRYITILVKGQVLKEIARQKKSD